DEGKRREMLLAGAKVRPGGAKKRGGGARGGVVLKKGPTLFQLFLEVPPPPPPRPAILVVFTPDRQTDAISCRHNDRSRPDLDVEFHRLSPLQWPLLIVRVVGAVGFRPLPVQLAVRRAQPSLCDRGVTIHCALQH